MWRDPTDVSKRKPQYLGGTPANKYSFIVCAGVITALTGLFQLISCTEWFHRHAERVKEKAIQNQKDRELRDFLNNPVIQRAVALKQNEYELDKSRLK